MTVEERVAETVQQGHPAGWQQQTAVDGLRWGFAFDLDGEAVVAEVNELGHVSPCVATSDGATG
ncbi:hypothetical protein GCM10010330_39630 [Streptomyces tendae]|nr:hypothetical protein GCM10010330_39630 [Streptomyces tendae]